MGNGKKMKMSKIQYFQVSMTSLDAEFHAEFDFEGPGAGGSQKRVVFDDFMIFPENVEKMENVIEWFKIDPLGSNIFQNVKKNLAHISKVV